MRKFVLVALCALLLTGSGCSIIKGWVVSTAKKTAVNYASDYVDRRVASEFTRRVLPRVEHVEQEIGHKLDADADGLWSEEELETALKEYTTEVAVDWLGQVKEDITNATDTAKLEVRGDIESRVAGLVDADNELRTSLDVTGAAVGEVASTVRNVASSVMAVDDRLTDTEERLTNTEGEVVDGIKSLDEKLDGKLDGSQALGGLIVLIILYILRKLGIKVGPKGVEKIKSIVGRIGLFGKKKKENRNVEL